MRSVAIVKVLQVALLEADGCIAVLSTQYYRRSFVLHTCFLLGPNCSTSIETQATNPRRSQSHRRSLDASKNFQRTCPRRSSRVSLSFEFLSPTS